MKKLLTLFCLLFLTTILYAQKPIVQNIHARTAKGTKIVVTWELPQNQEEQITNLYLYRNTKPFTSYSQVSSLIPLAILNATDTSYTDSVKDYNDYFYAVIAYTNNTKPYELILVSMNATVNGIHLNMPDQKQKDPEKQKEEKLYTDGALRETPLPYLDLIDETPAVSVISDETAKQTITFSTAKKANSEYDLLPYFFEEDLISPDGGDEYILFDILKNTFVQQKYVEARKQLKILVQRNITLSVQNRAYFYIGECEYYLGNYDEAVKAFIQVSQYYPLQTKKWINASLYKMPLEKE